MNDTGGILHHGCRVVMGRLLEMLSGRDYEIKTIPIGRDWEPQKGVIDNASAVFINGEGTMHHSSPVAKRLLAIVPYCTARGIPVFLINSIWQGNDDEMKNLAADFSLRYVRESESQKQFLREGLAASVVPDLTLGWEVRPVDSARPRSGRIYTDSADPKTSEFLIRQHRADAASHFVLLEPPAGDAEHWSSTELAENLFHGTSNLQRIKNFRLKDHVAACLLHLKPGARVARIKFKSGNVRLPLARFLEALESADLVVTGRFHAVCFCLLTGTPFLATATNSHKIYGMLRDAGLEHRLVELEDLAAVLLQPPVWTAEDSQKSAKFVLHAKLSQEKMMRNIFSAIGASGKV